MVSTSLLLHHGQYHEGCQDEPYPQNIRYLHGISFLVIHCSTKLVVHLSVDQNHCCPAESCGSINGTVSVGRPIRTQDKHGGVDGARFEAIKRHNVVVVVAIARWQENLLECKCHIVIMVHISIVDTR